MNEVKLTGRLVRDPELKHVGANGTALCQFSLVVNTGQGDKREGHFFDAKSWKSVAEDVARFSKGDLIDTKGFLVQEKWTAQDGAKRSKVVIVVTKVREAGSDNADGADIDFETSGDRAPAQRSTARKPDPGAYVPRSNVGAPPPGDIDVPFSPNCQWA